MKFSFSPVVALQDRQFFTYPSRPTGWTHVVLNYIGPNDGEGIRIYYNGEKVKSDTTKLAGSTSAGDGRIGVGKIHIDSDHGYSSVQVDELIFFNHNSTSDEIAALATAY